MRPGGKEDAKEYIDKLFREIDYRKTFIIESDQMAMAATKVRDESDKGDRIITQTVRKSTYRKKYRVQRLAGKARKEFLVFVAAISALKAV